MTPEIVQPHLTEFAARARREVSNATFFVFGSYLRRVALPSDIDVLGLCETDAEADKIRRVFDALAFELPIHLTLLTRNEEAESKFIDRAGAVEFT